MKNFLLISFIVISVVGALPQKRPTIVQNVSRFEDDESMRIILSEYNVEASRRCNRLAKANWGVDTNDGNEAMKAEQLAAVNYNAEYVEEQWRLYFKDAVLENYLDPEIKRQVELLKQIGTAGLEPADLEKLTSTITEMKEVYNNAVVCPYENQSDCKADEVLTLEPEITDQMGSSHDYDKLEYIWTEWHDKSGKLMREDYKTYVDLMNKAAVINGYTNAGEMWMSKYEVTPFPDFISLVDRLWGEVEPLYDKLHTFVRFKLMELYPGRLDKDDKNIPAHLLGNMWAQSWNGLFDRIKPYNASFDVTDKMQELNYDAFKMFELSNEFYMSLGLEDNEMSYTNEAIIEKPEQKITCHASAWDFCDGEDFRVKMCTSVDMQDFITVHHEMGHIQYFLQYKDHPIPFRTGANPGFHEAVGDTIALAVATPTHLAKIGLVENFEPNDEADINALLLTALKSIAFLPFGLLIDKWRWEVFSGEVIEANWNQRWWELREQYQKIKPPTERDETFFDAGAKFHVPANSQYIAYFMAHILEFQFYKAMCIEAGEYDPANPDIPLHRCDFYNSKEAGDKLKVGLKLGLSKHWKEALFEMTGESDISAAAILEYFKPLSDFLDRENAIKQRLMDYKDEAIQQCNLLQLAEWASAVDVENKDKDTLKAEAVLKYAEFAKATSAKFSDLKVDEIGDELSRRQVSSLQTLDTDILNVEQLTELQGAQSSMENTYDTARICPYDNQDCDKTNPAEYIVLDPGVGHVMATSNDYKELEYIWKEWRDNSGKLMRDDFKTYVRLVNVAAVENGKTDYGELWREKYEDPDFENTVDRLWTEVEPLYKELHKYVRNKLLNVYGEFMDKNDELIPAHLLGNMWAQSWVNIFEQVKPYDDASPLDITASLIEKGISVMDMFEESDKFYKDLGLPGNQMSYTGLAEIVAPTDGRKIACHASAWDFCDGADFRIKMCTSVDFEDFVTVHHEMGHIQYYIQYADQSPIFRGGANPGFHEAVGDLIALSVSTPKHLQSINLLDNYEGNDKDTINSLFLMALERVAFLPFGLLVDKFRWEVFSGAVTEANWNKRWWELREHYQKVKAPVDRDETDFDAGAKYHVPANSQYIAYFIAHILEFQMHSALCKTANQYDPSDPNKPLHNCDIAGSLEAGQKLKDGLSLGSSRHWSVALEAMTGDIDISSDGLLNYFEPLMKFLKEENAKNDGTAEPLDPDSNIPIIVGGVIGGLLIVALSGYGIHHYMNRKNTATLG